MKRKLILGSLTILVLALAVSSFFVFGTYSEGYRAGTIMKLSTKGYIFKTLEGQLNMGGMAGSDGGDVATTTWAFSVDKGNEQVVSTMENAVDNGARVKLFYKEKYFQFDWRGETKYFVYKVEEVGGN